MGTAQVQVEYLHRADSVETAALLQCVITTGTFPIFLWSFNGSTIPLGANSPTLIQNDQFLVLTHINPENSGYYSCRARDSFDSNSSWVESEDVLVEMTGEIRLHSKTKIPLPCTAMPWGQDKATYKFSKQVQAQKVSKKIHLK